MSIPAARCSDYPAAGSGYRKAVTDTITKAGVRAWAQRQAAEYRNGEDRPLGGYLKLMSVYAAGTGSALLAAKKLGAIRCGSPPGTPSNSVSPPTGSVARWRRTR